MPIWPKKVRIPWACHLSTKFTKPFIIETDASGIELGAVLVQDQRPIAYYSHALPPLAGLKLVYKQELMAIDLQSRNGGPIFWDADL